MEKEKRGLFQGEKSKFLLGAALLALLLLRAWQLRAPGLVGGLSEDEIHHNFWLIENQSALGNYTIWQLQPLLDYFLRLYVWFPVLRIGWPGVFLFAMLATAFVLFFRAVLNESIFRTNTNELGFPYLPRGHVELLARWYFLMIGIAAAHSVIALLVRSSEQGSTVQIALSPSRLASALLFFVASLLSFIAASRKRWRSRWTSYSERLIASKARFPALLVAALLSVLATLWFMLPATGLLSFSPGSHRLSLLILPLGFAALINLVALLILTKSKTGLVTTFALLAGALLLMLKPLSQHADYSELYLQIPTVFYSLLLVAAGFYLSLKVLGKREGRSYLGMAAAFFVAIWLAYHPAELALASVARHYTLIALASTIWFWCFLFLDSRRTFAFWVASLFLLNTHFFALPLVALAYLYETVLAWREGDSREALRTAIYGGLAGGATLLLNYPVVSYLFEISSEAATTQLSIVVSNFLSLLQGYLSFLAFPVSPGLTALPVLSRFETSLQGYQPVLLALLALAAVWFSKSKQRSRLLFLLLIALPICFLYLASRPAYDFRARYYFPFYGLGLVLLIVLFESLLSRKWRVDGSGFGGASLPTYLAAFLLLALLAAPFGLDFVAGLVQDLDRLSVPPANASANYEQYSEARNKSANLLHFVPSTVAVRNDIPAFYFEYVDGGYRGDWQLTGTGHNLDFRAVVDDYLIQHPGGNILFDWLLEGCRRVDLPEGVWDADVLRLRGGESCNLLIGGIESYEELCEIAHFVGYPPNATDESLCADVPE